MVEVQFKNTRKGFYINSLHLPLKVGDMVAVDAQPGYDMGKVSLTGQLVLLQMRKAGIKAGGELKRVFRIAKESDLEKFSQLRALEHPTMIRARQIADGLSLNMKIGDVEFQGDGSKAIFYYIADERVDFRQLIRVLADNFKVRIEMRQIGSRQEAGRIGAIGLCGRPLCCSSWMTNFNSVGTNAARVQDISLNPMKLAGQCGKLKCCLNFEMDSYVEAIKKLPPREIRLETEEKTYYHFKTDIFKGDITYSTSKNSAQDLVTVPAARVFEIIEMNKRGEKPESLAEEDENEKNSHRPDLLDQDSLTRFDKKKKRKKSKNKNREPKPEATEPAGNKNPEITENTPKVPEKPQGQPQKEGKGETNPQRNRNQQRRNRNSRPNPNKPAGPRPQANPEKPAPQPVKAAPPASPETPAQ